MNNEDFISIRKLKTTDTSTDTINVAFIDYETSVSQFPEMSVQLYSKEIKIDKEYNKNDILKEFIDKVIEISEPETYNERVYEHKTVKGVNTDKEIRQLMSRMISCGSYIAVNGRIGPAHFVLSPHRYYQKLSSLMTNGLIGGMKIIPTHLLTDIIIFGRINSEEQAGIFLFLDEKRNKYKLDELGTAKHQYHILKVTSLQEERKKKLEQIGNSQNI